MLHDLFRPPIPSPDDELFASLERSWRWIMDDLSWLQNPAALPPLLRRWLGQATERKLRLFACACCRRVRHLLPAEPSRRLIDLIEGYADGAVGREELDAVHDEASEIAHFELASYVDDGRFAAAKQGSEAVLQAGGRGPCGWQDALTAAAMAGQAAADGLLSSVTHDVHCLFTAAYNAEKAAQFGLLRDLLGNPFRPVAVRPSWLTWNDSTPLRMAQACYTQRSFERLPILADALEEASCDNPDLLTHLREPSRHARGCWALDILLGKG